MKTTPNLGLPQFEPTDKYRLEDYNEAYAKIDEKIKEAQDLIATWTQFKNNGGNIGGKVLIGGTIEADNTLRSKGNLLNLETMVDTVNGTFKKIHILGDEPSKSVFLYGEEPNLLNVGSPINVLKDVWVGGYSKNSNGFSKLSNGMIIQWGSVSDVISGAITNFNFPISFPNSCVQVIATLTGQVATGGLGVSTIIQTKSTGSLYHTNGANRNIRWLAIGY